MNLLVVACWLLHLCLILVVPVAAIVCLTVPVICLVIGVEVANVAVVDRHSTLFGHVSWQALVACFPFAPFPAG